MREPSESAESIIEVLESLGARWTIIGALAALEYRQDLRLTTDADFLVEWRDDLVAAFEESGFEVEIVADVGEPPHVLYVHGKGVKADLTARTGWRKARQGMLFTCRYGGSAKPAVPAAQQSQQSWRWTPRPASLSLRLFRALRALSHQ